MDLPENERSVVDKETVLARRKETRKRKRKEGTGSVMGEMDERQRNGWEGMEKLSNE